MSGRTTGKGGCRLLRQNENGNKITELEFSWIKLEKSGIWRYVSKSLSCLRLDYILSCMWKSTLVLHEHTWMLEVQGAVIWGDCSLSVPETAMSRRSSLKDTLFLSRAESECVVEGRGEWPESGGGRDMGSVGRTGELGHKKIPGLRRMGCFSSVQHTHTHKDTEDGWREINRGMEKTGRRKKKHSNQREEHRKERKGLEFTVMDKTIGTVRKYSVSPRKLLQIKLFLHLFIYLSNNEKSTKKNRQPEHDQTRAKFDIILCKIASLNSEKLNHTEHGGHKQVQRTVWRAKSQSQGNDRSISKDLNVKTVCLKPMGLRLSTHTNTDPRCERKNAWMEDKEQQLASNKIQTYFL